MMEDRDEIQNQRCINCQRLFTKDRIELHQAYCERNIRECNLCGRMIDRKQKEAHDKQYHSENPCHHCGQLINSNHLTLHLKKCLKRPVICKFCQNNYTYDQISTHQRVCNSQIKQCILCGKSIQLKDFDQHQQNCEFQVHELNRYKSQQDLNKKYKYSSHNIHNQLIIGRNGSQQMINLQKQVEISRNQYKRFHHRIQKRQKNIIPPEIIKSNIDIIPISIRLTLQRKKKKK